MKKITYDNDTHRIVLVQDDFFYRMDFENLREAIWYRECPYPFNNGFNGVEFSIIEGPDPEHVQLLKIKCHTITEIYRRMTAARNLLVPDLHSLELLKMAGEFKQMEYHQFLIEFLSNIRYGYF